MIVPACIILIASVSKSSYTFYGILMVAYALSGSVFSGFRVNQIELAPNFVGTITAICDLVGSFAMLSTHIAFIARFDAPKEQNTWDQICWSLFIMLIACVSMFIFFGSSKVQSWNKVDSETNEGITPD